MAGRNIRNIIYPKTNRRQIYRLENTQYANTSNEKEGDFQ